MKLKKYIFLLTAFVAACGSTSYLRYPPVYWMRDNDAKPVGPPPFQKAEIKRQETEYTMYNDYQLIVSQGNRFTSWIDPAVVGLKEESIDVNNFDEVIDSSWFENRILKGNLSIEGPLEADLGGKLALAGISRSSDNNIVVRNKAGELYLLKFDHPAYPELATAAEFIAGRILYLAGYNVFKSAIVMIDPKRIVYEDDSEFFSIEGSSEPVRREDLSGFLAKLPKGRKVRALAVKIENGSYIGPFKFDGRNNKDANDKIPHEHRRELRAYKIFSGFLNNSGQILTGTLDLFMMDKGCPISGAGGPVDARTVGGFSCKKGYVKHFLLNLSTSFGGAGLWTMPGRSDKDLFDDTDPNKWSSMLPNRAFMYLTDRDGYWAARVLSRFTDDMIDEIVAGAKLSDKAREGFMAGELKKRRDKITSYWFGQMNSLDDFRPVDIPEGKGIEFSDLRGGGKYIYKLMDHKGKFNLIPWVETPFPLIKISPDAIKEMKNKELYILRIRAKYEDKEWPTASVDVFLKKGPLGDPVMLGERRHYHR